jgi:CheY-like chemotaxis protein
MMPCKSFLLIDDDIDDQLLFSMVIEKIHGPAVCLMADNGLHALHQLEHDSSFVPDFIFIDLHLPGLGGIDFLIKIKKHATLAQIPVVIYTTSCSQSDIVRAKAYGAAGFITKTHDVVGLMRRLKDIFSNEDVHGSEENDLRVSVRASD